MRLFWNDFLTNVQDAMKCRTLLQYEEFERSQSLRSPRPASQIGLLFLRRKYQVMRDVGCLCSWSRGTKTLGTMETRELSL